MNFLRLLYLMITITVPALASPAKIVIIGAGLAGLTAAYRLQEQGIDVEVYEARKRLGGRVFSVYLDGEVGELGGQNILDGGRATNLKKLIADVGLSIEEKQTPYRLDYFLDHQVYSEKALLKEKQYTSEDLKARLTLAAKNSLNMKEVFDKILDPKDPLYTALSVRLSAYEGAPIDKLSSVYIETLYHILLGGISAAHRASDDQMMVHSASVAGGNTKLIEKIAQRLSSVHTDKVLRAVKKAEGKYQLHFADGYQTTADILLLTMPCTAYEDIDFEEEILPEEKLRTIKAVQYGTNAKILIPLKSALSDQFAFLNEDSIAFARKGSATATLYFVGESSLFSWDMMQKRYLSSTTMLRASSLDTSVFSLSPQCAEDKTLFCYAAPVGHSWPADPYSKGSYSYIAPGQETVFTETVLIGSERVKALFAPVDDTLFFAGEHASTLFDVPGTMEAACESAETAARLIIGRLRTWNPRQKIHSLSQGKQ